MMLLILGWLSFVFESSHPAGKVLFWCICELAGVQSLFLKFMSEISYSSVMMSRFTFLSPPGANYVIKRDAASLESRYLICLTTQLRGWTNCCLNMLVFRRARVDSSLWGFS